MTKRLSKRGIHRLIEKNLVIGELEREMLIAKVNGLKVDQVESFLLGYNDAGHHKEIDKRSPLYKDESYKSGREFYQAFAQAAKKTH